MAKHDKFHRTDCPICTDMTSAHGGAKTIHHSIHYYRSHCYNSPKRFLVSMLDIRVLLDAFAQLHVVVIAENHFRGSRVVICRCGKTKAASWVLCRAADCWSRTTEVKGQTPGLDQLTVSSTLLCTGEPVCNCCITLL